jgi:hypothetical protein
VTALRATLSRPRVAAFAWVVSAALPAAAQEIVLTGPLAGAPTAGKSDSVRSKTDARIVMPTGYLEVAGEVALVVSERSPYAESLGFTDLALLRLNVRRSFADWIELYAGGSLLPKQPTSTHAPLFQGAHLGAQAEYAPGLGATLGASAGPLFGADGVYYRCGPGLTWKPTADNYLRFVVGVGNAWTFLEYAQATQPAFFLGEIVTHAQTQIGDRNASMWVGFDYAVPFASSPDPATPDPGRGYLDPQVRLNLEVGGALSLRSDSWNVYATYAFVDRGESDKPETTLPILDGGFDQQQIAVGVVYRFDPKRSNDGDGW